MNLPEPKYKPIGTPRSDAWYRRNALGIGFKNKDRPGRPQKIKSLQSVGGRSRNKYFAVAERLKARFGHQWFTAKEAFDPDFNKGHWLLRKLYTRGLVERRANYNKKANSYRLRSL